MMNALASEKKLSVLSALVEGNSIRSIERMTGVNWNTIMSLLVRVGEGCARLNGNHKHSEMGDQYVFVGMDADTKLAISYLVGKRDATTAFYFMQDLKERLATRVQLTTDGFRPYLNAVEDTFGSDVDYAQLVELYGQQKRNGGDDREWYKPVRVMAAIPMRVGGRPDPRRISTSFIERQNLTIRMSVRRFTRLTNAFSKKLANLRAAVALHFAYYNFC